MIVMKFGGTSTEDAAAMRNVAGIVHSHIGAKPVVVISAIAQATNMLEQAGKNASAGKPEEALATIQKLIARHYAIVKEDISDSKRREELKAVISQASAELAELIRGVAILRELTPRSLDAFCCYGELLSSRLIAACLAERGVNACWIDTRDFMLTDSNFTTAVPIMEEVSPRLRNIVSAGIDQGKVYVTQGFIGANESGVRTTMGRESSDYSAAVIGAALEATDVQIWTDVDGILTGDPRTVSKPMKVKEMSFEEAHELSYFGAKVLHPNTLLPAIEKNIPIHVYNSRKPERSGTLIHSGAPSDEFHVKSVTHLSPVSLVRVAPSQRRGQFLFWDELFNILTKHGIAARAVTTSEYGIALAIDEKHIVPDVVRDLETLGKVTVTNGSGIVTVVGSNLSSNGDLLCRVFNALKGMRVSMVSTGASDCSVSFVVDVDSVVNVVDALHREFFEVVPDRELFEVLEELD
jgi:aspartate kinase